MNHIIDLDMRDIYSREVDWELLNNTTVLVTGAGGMLASYLIYFLIYLKKEKNFSIDIIAVVRDAQKYFGRYSDIVNELTVVEDDLSERVEIEGKVDYIIHAASLASPQYYEKCPVDVLMPNVIGNFNLLKLAVEKGVRGYLLFSSSDIYGAVSDQEQIDETTVGNLNTLDVHNCYSESKRMAETMCYSFYHQYNVPAKIARIWHTYAPTMDYKNDPRVFSSFVKNIVEGNNIELKSDGRGMRSFCYITDAIAGYFTILLKGKVGEAYNVCNESQYVSVYELAKELVAIYPEKGLDVISVSRAADEIYSENIHMKGRKMVPSSEKLCSLGWRYEVDIKTGFKRVIDYIETDKRK